MNQVIDKINNSKYAEKMRAHLVFQKYPSLKQMTKFALIGVINTFIDFIIYIFLTRGFPFWREHYLIANLIAFMIGISATFDIVRKWIFKLPILPRDEEEERKMSLTKKEERIIHIQYFKFLLVSSLGFSVNEIGLWILVEFVSFNDILSKILIGITVWVIRFNTHRFWTFKNKKSKKQ